MVDIVDMAQDQEQKLREQALRKFVKYDDSHKVDTDTPRYCQDCDDVIPIARVKAVPYCTRCIDCQERVERCQR